MMLSVYAHMHILPANECCAAEVREQHRWNTIVCVYVGFWSYASRGSSDHEHHADVQVIERLISRTAAIGVLTSINLLNTLFCSKPIALSICCHVNRTEVVATRAIRVLGVGVPPVLSCRLHAVARMQPQSITIMHYMFIYLDQPKD